MKFKTIKELYDAVKSGKIKEDNLRVVLDNDRTNFYVGEEKIEVIEAKGYSDIEHLYPLLFPNATVGWC